MSITTESENWIPGWLDPLRCALQATLTKVLAVQRPVIDGCLNQADKAVEKSTQGR